MIMLAGQQRRRRTNPFEVGGFKDFHNSWTIQDDDNDEDDDDEGFLVHSYDGSSELNLEDFGMQKIEMPLLAAKVFCNFFSTLILDLVLRIYYIKKPTDQPLAFKYKIGYKFPPGPYSKGCLEDVKLSTSLHNRSFSYIAVIIYDYGVVLTASERFTDQKWRAITTEAMSETDTVRLIITFHSF